LLSFNNLVRPNRLYRAVAVFFLLFTVFDLTSSWPCPEDGLENSFTQQSAQATQFLASLESPSTDQTDHQPGSNSEEHDCFCCCTHLAPVEVIRVADLRVTATVIPWNVTSLPIAPPQKTEHPPRLA
jgi:hypothetical protein